MIIGTISQPAEPSFCLLKGASFRPKPGCIVRVKAGEGEGDYDVKAVTDEGDHWHVILTPRHTTPCAPAPNMAHIR